MNRPKVKICCISSKDEAKLAISCGAGAIGLVSEMPSGPGVINEEIITEIAISVPKEINTFLLTSKQDTETIIQQVQRCKTNTVQIVDNLLEGKYADIRNALPHIKIVQVVHVHDQSTIDEALEISQYVDAILLDSGNLNLKVKELGGTGRTHDWSVSKNIVSAVSVPVFLAGGLNSDNIIEAVKTVQPYGVDLCSSVRTNGKLDEIKLKSFFNKINKLHEL